MSGPVKRAITALFAPSSVVELRAFNGRGTVSGYFDNHEALAEEAAQLDEKGLAVYVTLNDVDRALLARSANRTQPYPKATTADSDVLNRRWVLFDFDPVRASGISSTREEKKAALLRAREVRDHLSSLGWPESVVVDSGNGAHLLYRVDLPNDRETSELIKGVLEAVAFRFSDGAVEVDQSVHNAARIVKLYGTTARKGDHTVERPHRRSKLLKVPEQIEVVPREKLEEVARMRPSPPPNERGSSSGRQGFDIAEWIDEHNILVRRKGSWNAGGYRWILEECPWNGHTDKAAYIVRHPSGAIAAGCHHNSCQGYGWSELREHYEPGAYERRKESSSGAEAGDVSTPELMLSWPQLASEALYGLPGEIVKAIEPHTEADTVAVLANLLTAFGNAMGGGAYFRVGADKHHLKLNIALVGETSKGRKGMSWGYVKELMHVAEPSWVEDRVLNGLSSGEGLIYAVRDRVVTNKDGEEEVVDEGVSDKRLLVMEGELASVLKVMTREGNTLSTTIRTAWDGGKLCTLTKNSPLQATGSHISIIGHITKAELLRHLTETEAANGFANRFIWVAVKRSKKLPFGGEWHKVDVAPLVNKLRSAVEYGKEVGEITWGESAKDLWVEVYGPLSEGKPGLFGAVTGRAEAQVVRLAAVYAVMDKSHTIERPHLEAALALWRYAEDSARHIFGNATGDKVADRIEEALDTAPEGLTRNEIRGLFGGHRGSERVGQALSLLEKLGRVRREIEPTGGRPVERWHRK